MIAGMPSGQLKLEGGRLLREKNEPSGAGNPLFSIVTIVLNGAGEIDRTIRSVLAQSFRDFEFLVLDGGSTDGTVDVVRSYEDRIDYWRSQPDKGISDAFNQGIEASRGTFIGLLNAGDWYEPETLGVVADVLAASPGIDVIAGGIEFWKNGKPSLFCHSDPRALDHETSVYHPTVFIKKGTYQRLGGYDTSYKYAMDYELLLRFKRSGAWFHSIPQKLTNMGLDGISIRNWYSGLKEVRRARSRYFDTPNVVYYHTTAVVKNLIGNWMNAAGMRSLYRTYWRQRNRERVDV